ncbi:MAG: NAD(P) transhydrogenase subunit alpha [Acidimicrobiales bacterium]
MSEQSAPSKGEEAPEEGPIHPSVRATLTAGVLREQSRDERRVALVPDDVAKLDGISIDVVVESGAGEASFFPDLAYEKAGATIVDRSECLSRSNVILCVSRPEESDVQSFGAGQAVVGMLEPLVDPEYAKAIAARGATGISLDLLPRTLSRAQTMDALSSQASIAGYKAALLGASTFTRYFPLLMTAAGTARPAEVLVLGAGVAGLQAIATAHRLGAVVRGYDVRPDAKEQVESLGGRFIELTSVSDAAGEGGYARTLTADETKALQEELNAHIATHDVVITTAQVPGQRPPVLVTNEAIDAMKPGSVIVDMGSSALGGNVETSRPGETFVTDGGVTIVGAQNLASTMGAGASMAYSHNICALVAHFVVEGKFVVDLEDEIQKGVVVTHDGAIVNEATRARLGNSAAAPTSEDAER